MDEDDEQAAEERDAVDGDHIAIRSNGRDPITVRRTPDGRAPSAYYRPN